MKFENYVDLLLKEENENCKVVVKFIDERGFRLCTCKRKQLFLPITLNAEIKEIKKMQIQNSYEIEVLLLWKGGN